MKKSLELEKFIVIVVNSNREYVDYGVSIDKKIFSTHREAYEYMVSVAGKYRGERLVEKIERDAMYIEFEDYFIQADIVECSYTVTISD